MASIHSKILMIVSTLVGLGFLFLGVLYATHGAQSLPHGLPGFDPESTRVHTKHAIAAFLLGAAALIFAWFQTGKKPSGTEKPPTA